MVKAIEQQNSTDGPTRGPASASSPGPAPPSKTTARPAGAKLQYIDRPEIAETFADSVSELVFDGQVLRIEFATTRLDEIKPNTMITGRRYTACRIVLSPSGALDPCR